MLKLVKTDRGWSVDYAGTADAAQIQALFGVVVVPLPLTSAVSESEALTFARQTPAGRDLGVTL